VLATTLGPGDHAICQFPTYGQLYLLPRHLGVEVDLWVMKEENSWIPDIEELEKLIQPKTKAIILNNPNNPTGANLAGGTLEKIRSLAQQHDLTLIGDEVFRPLFHAPSLSPPSVVSLGYRKSVSTGSVSKAYSLAGIRIGWMISPDSDIITQVTNARDYTTLNVSRVDDGIAAFALSPAVLPRLIERNLDICALNLKSLDDLIARNPGRCAWTRPTGACTAFVRLRDSEGKLVDDLGFSQRLIDETGISVIPGDSCFGEEGVAGFRGYIRISLGQEPSLFAEALGKIEVLIRSL
ncbi:aspartate aminotransferase, partial [Colletotrichum sojae]